MYPGIVKVLRADIRIQAVGERIVKSSHVAPGAPAGFEHRYVVAAVARSSYAQARPAIPAPMTITFFFAAEAMPDPARPAIRPARFQQVSTFHSHPSGSSPRTHRGRLSTAA